MSLLVERRTERIDLGDGEWVEVLVSLSVKEACELQELSGKGLTEATLGVLKGLIVAWSDDTPITEEAIARLRPEVAERIMTRFQEIAAAPNPKASSSPSTATSKRKARSPTLMR